MKMQGKTFRKVAELKVEVVLFQLQTWKIAYLHGRYRHRPTPSWCNVQCARWRLAISYLRHKMRLRGDLLSIARMISISSSPETQIASSMFVVDWQIRWQEGWENKQGGTHHHLPYLQPDGILRQNALL
jgi:hypothetical protein